jgi:hypothetical protein
VSLGPLERIKSQTDALPSTPYEFDEKAFDETSYNSQTRAASSRELSGHTEG